MNMNVLVLAACAGGVAVQALDARSKLRLTLIVAQWGALTWVAVRVASFALGVATA